MGVEIRLRGTAIPCIAEQAIKAGLAVKLVPSTLAPKILGGNADPDPRLQGYYYNVLQGANLPTADDDTTAKYVAAFRVYNEKPPLYETLPANNESSVAVPYTLREFSEGEENLPADVTLRMVVPRLKDDATIPSGALMLAYDEGIYTVTSGCFYDNVEDYVIGEGLSVKGTTGKWYRGGSGDVAYVFEANRTRQTLTIKTGS